MRHFLFCICALCCAPACAQHIVVTRPSDTIPGQQEIFYVRLSTDTIRDSIYTRYLHGKLKCKGQYAENKKEGEWFNYSYDGTKVSDSYYYMHDTLNGTWTSFDYFGHTVRVCNYASGMRNGLYEEFSGKILRDSGYYVMDRKEGPWVFYDINGKLQKSGNYEKDQPAGTWKYYEKGELFQEYDYSSHRILWDAYAGINSGFIVYDSLHHAVDTLDAGCSYIGGMTEFYSFVAAHLQYPEAARAGDITGSVSVRFTIDTLGHVIHARALNRVGGGCEAEAVRLINSTSGNWIPAMDHGKPVPVEMTVPIRFMNE